MVKVNKVKIEITKLNYQRNAKTFCNTVLMLEMLKWLITMF